MDNTSYVNARCPHCEAPATIEAYSHYPGGRRLGQETLYSLETKDCECEWSHGDARRAIKALYDDVA